VLEGPPVKLSYGLAGTKTKPTSLPTAPYGTLVSCIRVRDSHGNLAEVGIETQPSIFEPIMKYDTIGIGYDTTRRPDRRIAQRLFELLDPVRNGNYADIACGTGNYTQALHALGVQLVGIDGSCIMLHAARAKCPTISWHLANVTALPFPDGHFDGVICTQAIHHFSDLVGAFREIGRVLRVGRLVIFTSSRDQMRSYWLNAYFPNAMARAIDQLPSDQQLQAALESTKLRVVLTEPWFVPSDPVDLFLYSGKHNPSIYFNERVRQGISTFANLADSEEVAEGLTRLRNDIASGSIADVVARYSSDNGDYRFVVAQQVPK
jgi:ubiquinone/menaquinone biosynthesis C-methylase UbiE